MKPESLNLKTLENLNAQPKMSGDPKLLQQHLAKGDSKLKLCFTTSSLNKLWAIGRCLSYLGSLQEKTTQGFSIMDLPKAFHFRPIVGTEVREQVKGSLQTHGHPKLAAQQMILLLHNMILSIILFLGDGNFSQVHERVHKHLIRRFTSGTDSLTPSNACKRCTKKSLRSRKAFTMVATASPPA
jgi:hypothetical protein